MDHSKRRRKAIVKLDFENCEVTTVRMRKKFRKRLKAKTISEYEDEIISSLQSQNSSKDSNQEQKDEEEKEKVHNSPILFRKCPSQNRALKTPSPILITKQKSILMKRLKTEDDPKPSTSISGDGETTTSPVFKFKYGSNKKKSQKDKSYTSNESKPFFILTSDDDHSANEWDIEDLSQEQTKGNSEECKISILSSENTISSDINISEEISGENLSLENEQLASDSPTFEANMDASEEHDSDEESREYHRGGLIEKLFDLRKKQSSEKRICDHNRKLMKFEKLRTRKLYVIEEWKSLAQLTLKCQYVDVSEDALFLNSDPTNFVYVIINRDKEKYLKKIKNGTFVRITAPWHEIKLPTLNRSVLLSVTFIEIIDSIPDFKIPRTILREVSAVKYKENEALLFDTILAPVANI